MNQTLIIYICISFTILITFFLDHITRNHGSFKLEELVKKVPFWTFDNSTMHLFWTSHIEHVLFDGLSIWLMIFFTNIKRDILTSQFVQMAIWMVVKSSIIFIHHMSSSYAIIIATCQVECTCIIDMCHQFKVCIVTCPNLKWYLHAMCCHLGSS